MLPNFACKEAQTCAVEKRYNLESVRSFGGSSSTSHLLVGAGMRVKFFLNIYAVGLYVTKNKHKVIQSSWAKLGAVDLSTNSGTDDYPIVLLLKFQRAVGTDKVVDALVDALAVEAAPSSEKDYSTKLGQFKNTLLGKIGTGGTQTGDEIEFVFPKSNAEVGVRLLKAGSDAKNSKFDFVKSKTLRDKLLDVYLSKEKAVAPDLLKSIESVYSNKK